MFVQGVEELSVKSVMRILMRPAVGPCSMTSSLTSTELCDILELPGVGEVRILPMASHHLQQSWHSMHTVREAHGGAQSYRPALGPLSRMEKAVGVRV